MRFHPFAVRQVNDMRFDVIDRGVTVDGGQERRLAARRMRSKQPLQEAAGAGR